MFAIPSHSTKMLQILCSIMKWCWSRLKGGVVTWSTYELFRTGEKGVYGFTIAPCFTQTPCRVSHGQIRL